jgi:hypothetical protein
MHRYSASLAATSPAVTVSASSPRTHLDATAVFSLLLCCCLWGLNQVSIKAALPEVPVLVQLAMRSVIAFGLLMAWMRWRGIRWDWRDGTLGPGLLAGTLFAVEFGLARSSACSTPPRRVAWCSSTRRRSSSPSCWRRRIAGRS